MTHITKPSRSSRLRCSATLLALLTTAVMGCGSTTTQSGARQPDPASITNSASGTADRASQPLEAIVADMATPIDGRSAANLIDVTVWVGDAVFERCGAQTTFMSEGDRYDQTMFPDLGRIAREGIALGAPTQTPEPESRTPDKKCLASTIPEMADVQKVQGEWMDTVVTPAWADTTIVASADDAAQCLRSRLRFSSDDLPSLDAFFGAVDGRVTQMETMTESERAAAIKALDSEASDALVVCATNTYRSFTARLKAARPAFLDRHNEAIASLASALDQAGYTP
jgi:hypothetical protein